MPGIDHLPGGCRHVTRARHPAGRPRWRLSRWLYLDGTAEADPAGHGADLVLWSSHRRCDRGELVKCVFTSESLDAERVIRRHT